MKAQRCKKTISLILTLLICLMFFFTGAFALDEKKNNIPLRLLGTVIDLEPANCIAVIRDLTAQKQGSYKISDMVAGYQLVKITRGQIYLLKDGQLYTLELPLGALQPVTVIGTDTVLISRQAILKTIGNINDAIRQVMPLPYIEGGKMIGFQLTNANKQPLLKTAGLKEGDVITQVNGMKLESIPKTLEAYHKSFNEEKVKVEIKRGNDFKKILFYVN